MASEREATASPSVPSRPGGDSGALPPFSIDGYRDTLERLLAAGYRPGRVVDLPLLAPPLLKPGERRLLLRHDLDLLVEPALPVARVEAELGLTATYYVLLTGPYSPCAPRARAALAALRDLGHDVGLHYDLRACPPGSSALTWLREQVSLLEAIASAPVQTISTHEPFRGGDDPFRDHAPWVHPHDRRWAGRFTYVSDSARGWRDDTLRRCLRGELAGPLLWLTHPELWLGGPRDRFTYLAEQVLPRALAPLRRYFEREVCAIWSGHAGAQAHDAEEADAGRAVRWQWLDEAGARAHAGALVALLAQCMPELAWGPAHLLSPRPHKWALSLVAWQGSTPVALAIDSATDDARGQGWLHVHAFAVGPEHRRAGLGRAMVHRLRARAAAHHLAGVRLRVAWENTDAIEFYGRCGFCIEASEPQARQLVLNYPLPAAARATAPAEDAP